MIASSIAISGMRASMTRIDASASNVANMNVTGATLRGRAESAQQGKVVETAYQPVTTYTNEVAGGGVQTKVVTVPHSSEMRYDPTSSSADSQGLVQAPDVDPVTETVEQMSALQAYRANVVVYRTAGQMEGTLFDGRA